MGAIAENRLEGWTVYDRPTDFPSTIVARRWVAARGRIVMTEDVIVAPTLDDARAAIRLAGPSLIRFPRDRSDDPKIMETWL